jgi:prevent-host-death family protein
MGPWIVNITTKLGATENAVSAADANRDFSHVLREVRSGVSYVVTAHGKPVAHIVPCKPADAARAAARSALPQRLRDYPVTDIGPWSRDDLYER